MGFQSTRCHVEGLISPLISLCSRKLDALLELPENHNHRIADLVDLVALPRNGHKHLPAPAPSSPSSNVQPRMTAMVEHRPAPTAALLRQGVRQHRPDRAPPGQGPPAWETFR